MKQNQHRRFLTYCLLLSYWIRGELGFQVSFHSLAIIIPIKFVTTSIISFGLMSQGYYIFLFSKSVLLTPNCTFQILKTNSKLFAYMRELHFVLGSPSVLSHSWIWSFVDSNAYWDVNFQWFVTIKYFLNKAQTLILAIMCPLL